MKDFFKTLLGIIVLVGAFFIGFQFGRTKEKAKIPNFQEDSEGRL